jgi:glycosyltransferase involved in cell wall biosynthesis
VLDGITGWRFAAGDAASLAAAMLRASDTPSAERSTIAETARAAIEKRSNVEQMVACFEASLAALKAGR